MLSLVDSRAVEFLGCAKRMAFMSGALLLGVNQSVEPVRNGLINRGRSVMLLD